MAGELRPEDHPLWQHFEEFATRNNWSLAGGHRFNGPVWENQWLAFLHGIETAHKILKEDRKL